MNQSTIDKVAIGIKVFGAVLFAVCLGALIWSLFRPPVTDGPMPPDPWQQQQGH
jgi:hypothetical protein